MKEFDGVEAMGYATKDEAEQAARRWATEKECDVTIRPADGIDQAYCDLGDEMKWVVERTEYPHHTDLGTAHSPEDGGWYAYRHSHEYNPQNDLFTGVYPNKADALTAARAGNWV